MAKVRAAGYRFSADGSQIPARDRSRYMVDYNIRARDNESWCFYVSWQSLARSEQRWMRGIDHLLECERDEAEAVRRKERAKRVIKAEAALLGGIL